MEEKRIVLKFKQIDSLRSFHEILEKTGQFELKEDRDLLGDYELTVEIPLYASLMPKNIFYSKTQRMAQRKMKFFIVNSGKFSLCLKYAISVKNQEKEEFSRFLILIIESDGNADTNAEQSEFIDDITQNEIQIMKFLDFYDMKEFFVLMGVCFKEKRKEMEELQRELYRTVEEEFEEILNTI